MGETAANSICCPVRQLVTQISNQECLLPSGACCVQMDFWYGKKREYIPMKDLLAACFPHMWNDMSQRVTGATETSQKISHRSQHWMWDFSVVSLFTCALSSP